ncbi:tumor necrosis factor receptor superfamily member 18 [Archocentrus centrarchus]|uniref:tumor necrosis factor receptor superfamily member 18 n=1 Tax=Archocentrus centrarchus TaxID=63155 RepID=UPI0011EA401A|nr:tumor necrosis factor receptor superfamily member 3-like [Archocentrus centrarchus]
MGPMSLLVLTLWTIGNVKGCGVRQTKIDGRCCDLCQPGTFVKEFCSESQQSVCEACPEGSFSHFDNVFDRCEKCQTCQFYDRKCTSTTNATCTCAAGFLCSNSICSTCVEDKCVIGERLKQTVISSDEKVIEYSYQCEPICRENEYFDVQKNICKLLTQCRPFGFAERFPGNRTHDTVCERNDGHFIHVILGISVILLSLSLFLFLSYTCIKYLRMHTANCKPTLAVPANIIDFHLPKEESGLQFFQDELKNSDTSHKLHLETIIIS